MLVIYPSCPLVPSLRAVQLLAFRCGIEISSPSVADRSNNGRYVFLMTQCMYSVYKVIVEYAYVARNDVFPHVAKLNGF